MLAETQTCLRLQLRREESGPARALFQQICSVAEVLAVVRATAPMSHRLRRGANCRPGSQQLGVHAPGINAFRRAGWSNRRGRREVYAKLPGRRQAADSGRRFRPLCVHRHANARELPYPTLWAVWMASGWAANEWG